MAHSYYSKVIGLETITFLQKSVLENPSGQLKILSENILKNSFSEDYFNLSR